MEVCKLKEVFVGTCDKWCAVAPHWVCASVEEDAWTSYPVITCTASHFGACLQLGHVRGPLVGSYRQYQLIL